MEIKFLLIFTLFFVLLSIIGSQSTFGSKNELCLFSEVRGVVIMDNKPMSNVKIERKYTWAWKNDKSIQDFTTSDEMGRFYFPPAFGESFFATKLSHQPQILQIIKIHYDNKTFTAWNLEKRNYDVNGEVNGKKLNLICDLSSQPSTKENLYYGICTIVKDL